MMFAVSDVRHICQSDTVSAISSRILIVNLAMFRSIHIHWKQKLHVDRAMISLSLSKRSLALKDIRHWLTTVLVIIYRWIRLKIGIRW